MVVYALATFLAILYGAYKFGKQCRSLSLPPGPLKLPVIGNILSIPSERQWVTYSKWCEENETDLLHLDAAGTSILILHTAAAATDLLEKRGAIYSSRVCTTMFHELMGWDFNFGSMRYGDQWRACRRLFTDRFNTNAARSFRPQEIRATHELLRRLLDRPMDFVDHLRHMAGSLIISIAYGIDVLPAGDPYIEIAERCNNELAIAGTPGAFLVDFIPLLKHIPSWLPGMAFKRQAREWRKDTIKMVEMPFAAVKSAKAAGVERPSFVSDCLDKINQDEDIASQEDLIKRTAATMYTAGADTTVGTLSSFFLGMLVNPRAVRRAQEEIDAVLRNGSLPTFEDEPFLPYVSAIVKESLRWNNALPLGVMHVIEVEDVYKGYRIPANTIVMPNVWAMLHDETDYPDPFNFEPERFLKDGKLDPGVRDPVTLAFGFGRRICPGLHFAYSSVWIAVASILTCFDISPAVDESGATIPVSCEYSGGMLSSPPLFRCTIQPRSPKAAAYIRNMTDM
ncbi:cytochrome P450 [Mycena latifolia]|nr:cytochrome P450 [Mycena latifolia]